MNRRFLIVPLLLACASAFAQLPYDAYTLASRDLNGTTRYVGMGGAMAAIGGDPSAAADNPAGLGLYRRNEMSLTLDYQFGNNDLGQRHNKFFCGQASWNFCFLQDRMKGVIANNLMLNYRRLKNFRRDYAMSIRDMAYSQTDVMALKTTGLEEKYLQGNEAWYDSEVGWLSKMGYEAYLINPDSTSLSGFEWLPANTGAVDGSISVSEAGACDEFAVSWGMNISNQWYIGLEMGLRSLSYNKSTTYNESFDNGAHYVMTAFSGANGVGFVSKIGVLYRPVSWLRFGAAFHAPVPMTVTFRNYGSVQSMLAAPAVPASVSQTSIENVYSTSAYAQPLQVVAGTAFQLSTLGMLSLQYNYQHGVKSSDPGDVAAGKKSGLGYHSLRVGAECILANNWFINLGYACNLSAPLNASDQPIGLAIPYNSTRLDTERCFFTRAHYISAGVSFRHKYVIVGAAYQCRLMSEALYFHELQPTAEPFRTTTHHLNFTIAWRR